MNAASSQRLLNEVPPRLAELLGVPVGELTVEWQLASPGGIADMAVSSGIHHFVVEFKMDGYAATMAHASRQVKRYAEAAGKRAIPLVAVPYMGEVGQRLCEEAGVSWLDLSGNARIVAPGLRVQVVGKPNLFKRVGRPRSLFAPKSSRIARWLLMKGDQSFTQRELARMSELNEGFTSRVVRGLEEQRLVARDDGGAVRAADRDALLDALLEAYDFSKHHIVRGHVAARSSDEVLRRWGSALDHGGIRHAVTGLAGAWLWSGFTGFRLVVVFVADLPDEKTRDLMGFHEMERGENVWLVQPNDEGVFHGSDLQEGICCAHPVQVYLDLKGHPERSAEAAKELREKVLTKSANA